MPALLLLGVGGVDERLRRLDDLGVDELASDGAAARTLFDGDADRAVTGARVVVGLEEALDDRAQSAVGDGDAGTDDAEGEDDDEQAPPHGGLALGGAVVPSATPLAPGALGRQLCLARLTAARGRRCDVLVVGHGVVDVGVVIVVTEDR